MKIMQKKELEAYIGKANFWLPKRTVNLGTYLSGIESFDQYIDTSKVFSVPNISDFEIHEKGMSITMVKGVKRRKIGVLFDNIVSINLEDKQQIMERKEKSVVGRAVVGGLLLGPVGALVGGMSGLKDGVKSAEMPDLILSIEISKNNQTNKLLTFGIRYKNKEESKMFFSKHFKSKFKILQE